MIFRLRLITRIALFAALIYVFSWVTTPLPNVNLIFFIIFAAGFLWGILPGMLVGAIGMALWSTFNPFGPAPVPIMIAQVLGASAGGIVGALTYKFRCHRKNRLTKNIWLVLAGALCTLLFYLPVNVADAWMFQPFWPRFIIGFSWAGISFVVNMIIFPLLFKVVEYLYSRESIKQ